MSVKRFCNQLSVHAIKALAHLFVAQAPIGSPVMLASNHRRLVRVHHCRVKTAMGSFRTVNYLESFSHTARLARFSLQNKAVVVWRKLCSGTPRPRATVTRQRGPATCRIASAAILPSRPTFQASPSKWALTQSANSPPQSRNWRKLCAKAFATSALLALTGCATTQYKYIPTYCLSPAQQLPAEPPKIHDQLTGDASKDVGLLAGSAIRLRSWGEGLQTILEGCRQPGAVAK